MFTKLYSFIGLLSYSHYLVQFIALVIDLQLVYRIWHLTRFIGASKTLCNDVFFFCLCLLPCHFFAVLKSTDFLVQSIDGGGTFCLLFWNLHKIWITPCDCTIECKHLESRIEYGKFLSNGLCKNSTIVSSNSYSTSGNQEVLWGEILCFILALNLSDFDS